MSNNNASTSITFKIVKSLKVLSTSPAGWTKEVNLVSWNDGPAKFDIRDWDENHEHMSRGITLYAKEAAQLARAINYELSKSQKKAK